MDSSNTSGAKDPFDALFDEFGIAPNDPARAFHKFMMGQPLRDETSDKCEETEQPKNLDGLFSTVKTPGIQTLGENELSRRSSKKKVEALPSKENELMESSEIIENAFKQSGVRYVKVQREIEHESIKVNFISTAFHFLLMVNFMFVIHYDLFVLEPDENHAKLQKIGLGKLKFLTFWNLLLQCIYFTIAFTNDLFGSNESSHKKQSRLQMKRDFIFTTIGFSVATFVSIAFWGLYAVDRELIFPVHMDAWFPSWLNHGMHTVPIVGVLLEVLLVEHKFPKHTTGVITISMFTMIYLTWVLFIAYYWGFWVYPVLRDLSIIGRAIFIAGCCLALSVFYFLGELLHNLVWGSEMDKSKTNKNI